MKYTFDHDFHLHSHLSKCSSDPAQTTQAMLAYAERNGLKKICIADHMWEGIPYLDEWYKGQDFAHISKSLPLPKGENVKFCFGAEIEMDKYFNLSVKRETIDKLDFLIIPTTHMNHYGCTCDRDIGEEGLARLWFDRLAALLHMDLPWYKIGIAHLSCDLLTGPYPVSRRAAILRRIPRNDMRVLFRMIAERGAGFELNFHADCEDNDYIFGIYALAKEEGCKFYLGSDAHFPLDFDFAPGNFRAIIDRLGLEESDKFDFPVS